MRRKIDTYLLRWKESSNKLPLIVRGARQVGKTYSIRQFGKTYRSFIEINFVTHPEYKRIFTNGYDTKNVVMAISMINPDFKFIEHDTLLFFDELQECPDCTTSLKFFKQDGKYDVVCSGSMMGLIYKEITSISVGYKTDVTMYSLDFEEFLWAKGYKDEHIENIFRHLVDTIPFSAVELEVLNEKFLEYIIVGGMPAIVHNFIESNNFTSTLVMQRQLLFDYEEDITKYAHGVDKAKIKNVYRNIPVFLAKDNKKFQISKVTANSRSRDYIGCIDWLNDAGIINICYCISYPELPLRGNYNETKYKIYFHDNGLLMASLDEYSLEDLRRNRNLGVYKGAIYENVVCEALVKSGFDAYYFKKENAQLEMDFFIRDMHSLIPVEVKAKDAATISLNNLINSDSYPDIKYGIKLCRKNIGFNGKFYTFPYFTTFLLKRWIDERN